MKKIRVLTMLLCLLLTFQSSFLPALATEPSQDTEPGYTEETLPTLAVGDAAINYGCRTIDGQSPLGGTDRVLKTAQAAFVYETTTDTVIYAYNPDLRLYPGSLSKVLTALIAIEKGNLTDKITVSTREISRLPAGVITSQLKNGEIVTLEDLLHCLILASANDAALVIAEYVAGDEASFVKLMNERVKEMGCTNTYLTNCHGLDDSDQYTTARDMAKITMEACKNATFKELFGCVDYSIPPTNKVEEERELESGNYLIYDKFLPQFNDQRVTGAMPSYVSATSGASITFTAESKNMSLIVILLGCNRTLVEGSTWKVDYYGNFNEALDIMEYTFNGYQLNRIIYSGQALKTFQVSNGENSVVGSPNVEIDTVLPVNVKMSNLNDKYTIVKGGLSAPIRAGDKIATVQLWYGSSCVAETELFAMSDVQSLGDRSLQIAGASRDDSNLSDFLGLLGVLCLIILVPIAGYLIYNSIMRSRVRAKRRRRRASRRRSR